MIEAIEKKSSQSAVPTLLTVKGFAEKHQFMTESSLRALIFQSGQRVEKALVRVGSRIFIDEKKFFDFIESHTTTPKGESGDCA